MDEVNVQVAIGHFHIHGFDAGALGAASLVPDIEILEFAAFHNIREYPPARSLDGVVGFGELYFSKIVAIRNRVRKPGQRRIVRFGTVPGPLVLTIARLLERSAICPSAKPWSASHKLPSESVSGWDEPALMRIGGGTGAGAAFSGGTEGTGVAISGVDEPLVASARAVTPGFPPKGVRYFREDFMCEHDDKKEADDDHARPGGQEPRPRAGPGWGQSGCPRKRFPHVRLHQNDERPDAHGQADQAAGHDGQDGCGHGPGMAPEP